MPLYLLRHGEAAPGNNDALRPLTLGGRRAVREVANYAIVHSMQVDQIWHSGLVRAEQTAQLFAEALGYSGAITRRAGLQPEDDPDAMARTLFEVEAAQSKASLLLVGHLPFMERLAARLQAGLTTPDPVRFRPATLAKLTAVANQRRYELEWILTP